MKNTKPQFTQKDVEIISKETGFKNYFQVDIYKLRFRLFLGGWSHIITREVFERGRAAAVLPYDPHLNKVVLIEQFRVGALKDERSPWLLELVAGMLDHDETPEQLAKREAQEEANIEILDLIPICNYWVSPGGCTERTMLFCGIVDASKANGIHGLDEEDEDIKVHVFDVEDAFKMLHDGVINNASTVIALQWLALQKNLEAAHSVQNESFTKY
ncbi:MAG: NUDIX domain-containing protein [Gammaproteobacteria bacterium]|nr:NUDIX domain-containing protein [Gammaproteobacteria bacterium]